jgi:hypothetical protein
MRREHRKLTCSELASITSRKPVVRRVKASDNCRTWVQPSSSSPGRPDAWNFFESNLTKPSEDAEDIKNSEGG